MTRGLMMDTDEMLEKLNNDGWRNHGWLNGRGVGMAYVFNFGNGIEVNILTQIGLPYGTAYQLAIMGLTANDIRKLIAACEATGQDIHAVLQTILATGLAVIDPLPKFKTDESEDE